MKVALNTIKTNNKQNMFSDDLIIYFIRSVLFFQLKTSQKTLINNYIETQDRI